VGKVSAVLLGPRRSRAAGCTGLGQLLPQHLDLSMKFAGVDSQLDALLLGFGELGTEFGVLRLQLEQDHFGRRQGDLIDVALGR